MRNPSRPRISFSSSSAIVVESASSGDGLLDGGEVGPPLAGEIVEEPGDRADRQRAELDERLAADANGPRAGVEPGPLAVGAGHAPHVGFELGAGRAAGRRFELAEELVGNPFPFLGVRPDLASALPVMDDHAVAGAVEPGVLPLRVEVLPGPP